MEEKKYLIINADDFGMCHAYNQAVFDLLENNAITSSTLMPVTPGRDEAAAWCLQKKIRCVGLHTTLTSEWPSFKWRSLTHKSSLEDENGFLYPDCESFWKNAKREDVACELDAQFSWFSKSGIFFSHADNHMGSLYPLNINGQPDYLPLVFERCKKYGLAFRMFRKNYWNEGAYIPLEFAQKDIALADEMHVPLLDTLFSFPFTSPAAETYDEFKNTVCRLLYDMPGGVNEIYFHPSVDIPEVHTITDTWQRRVWDYELLMDEDFSYALRDAGIIKISYRQIEELR